MLQIIQLERCSV